MAYTKGPWYIIDLGPTQDGIPYHIVQAGGKNPGDGFTDDGHMSVSGSIDIHDARLIAAAPEMFEFIKRQLEAYKQCQYEGEFQFDDEWAEKILKGVDSCQ